MYSKTIALNGQLQLMAIFYCQILYFIFILQPTSQANVMATNTKLAQVWQAIFMVKKKLRLMYWDMSKTGNFYGEGGAQASVLGLRID